MNELLQTVVNGPAISLEIVGFVIMLKSVKAISMRAHETGSIEVQPATGKESWALPALPDRSKYRVGIGFILAGLGGQILAMLV